MEQALARHAALVKLLYTVLPLLDESAHGKQRLCCPPVVASNSASSIRNVLKQRPSMQETASLRTKI